MRLRRLLTFRPVLLLVALLLIAGGWEAYGRISEQSRLTPSVQQALQTGEPLDVVLTLPFAPEQFHVKLLQRYGTVSGVQADHVIIRRVPPDRLQELGKSYWIRQIDLEQS